MEIEFLATDQLTQSHKDALQVLRQAVYPPEVLASLPGNRFTWASPQWSIFIWDNDQLVSRVGLLQREILSNGQKKSIGGIGGVATHPESQGKGYASLAMRAASDVMNTKWDVAFALLFCRPHLVPFYERLGWKPFAGNVFVEQPEGRLEFSANGAMVLDIKEQSPLDGTLDLCGLPW